MRLREVSIRGFRGYGAEITIPFDENFTALAGRNDAGKSSILEAIDLFLNGAKLDPSDISVGSNGMVEIACSFDCLPAEVVLDSDRSTTLSGEHLLDHRDWLVLVKRWSAERLNAPELLARAVHPRLRDGMDPLNAKIGDLKTLAKSFSIDETTVDMRVKAEIRAAIWSVTVASGQAEMRSGEVRLASEDGKSVGQALARYFPVFHLFRADRSGVESDQLAQDPAKAIVKAVLEKHQAELDAVNQSIQTEISEMLTAVVDKLGEVAPGLASELQPIEPAPSWPKAYGGMQFVDEQGVPLARRGSGTRRLVLLSFFRAEIDKYLDDVDAGDGNVIIAVEEPETALHADMQHEILGALMDVAALGGHQVLATTHSANLLRSIPPGAIRYIRREGAERRCITSQERDGRSLFEELNASLGVFTDHNVRCFVLVEGRNDIDALKWLTGAMSSVAGSRVSSFVELEKQGRLAFMPIGGSGSASLWQSTLSPFSRPEVHVFDSDRSEAGGPLKPEVAEALASANGKRRVRVLDRRELENYLDINALSAAYDDVPGFAERFTALLPAAGPYYADIPTLCARIVYEIHTGLSWDELTESSASKKESNAKKRLARAFDSVALAEAIVHDQNDLLEILRMVSSLACDDAAAGKAAEKEAAGSAL